MMMMGTTSTPPPPLPPQTTIDGPDAVRNENEDNNNHRPGAALPIVEQSINHRKIAKNEVLGDVSQSDTEKAVEDIREKIVNKGWI